MSEKNSFPVYEPAGVASIPGLVDAMNHAFKEVFLNIADPNKDITAKRKVTATITFSPAKLDRSQASVTSTVKVTLATDTPVETMVKLNSCGEGVIPQLDQLEIFADRELEILSGKENSR